MALGNSLSSAQMLKFIDPTRPEREIRNCLAMTAESNTSTTISLTLQQLFITPDTMKRPCSHSTVWVSGRRAYAHAGGPAFKIFEEVFFPIL